MPADRQRRADGRATGRPGRPGRRRQPGDGELSVADLLVRVGQESGSERLPGQRRLDPGHRVQVSGGQVSGGQVSGGQVSGSQVSGSQTTAVQRVPEDPWRHRHDETGGSARRHGASLLGVAGGADHAAAGRREAVGRWLTGALTGSTALIVLAALTGTPEFAGDPDLAGAANIARGDTVLPTNGPGAAGGALADSLDDIGGIGAGPPASDDAKDKAEQESEASRRKRAGNCARPGQIIDLVNWKLTLPTGSASSPSEITGQRLRSFTSADWFAVGGGCEAVAFRAPVNGVTTKGSKNPRSELREMTAGGTGKASWSSTSGTHTMTVRQAFTKLPTGKPHLVGAQIHDADDDVTVFRLEGGNLYVTNGDDSHYQLVTSNYILGTPFEARYVVSGGVTKAYYNGRLVTTIAKDYSGAYFKAGAYTQANCQNAAPCDSGNYGETLVYSLKVTHTP